MSKKIKKILSLVLTGAIVLGTLAGCSNKEADSEVKIDVPIEEAFTTLPEQTLLTNNMKELLTNFDQRKKEFITFESFFFGDGSKADQEIVDKYKFVKPSNKNDMVAIQKQAPELFEDYTTSLTWSVYNNEKKLQVLSDNFAILTQNYFSDVWVGKNVGEYGLTKEFRELDPKSVVKNYLKENKITDIEITNYPNKPIRFDLLPKYFLYTYPLDIKGTQDGKSFEKTIYVDMFFTTSEQNRKEMDVKLDMTDWEIEQVKLYTDTEMSDLIYTTKLNINKTKSDFGIK